MKGAIISDFNAQPLAGLLLNRFQIDTAVAPFGQVAEIILNPAAALWDRSQDFVILWTRPESMLPTVRKSLEGHAVETSDLDKEVETVIALLRECSKRAKWLFIAAWTLSSFHTGAGLTDFQLPHGPLRLLARANLRLYEGLDTIPNGRILNTEQWLRRGGDNGFSSRLWYSAKIPYTTEVFSAAAEDIDSGLKAAFGRSRKVIIVDLDDTIWGGIVGDVGWRGLKLGGHDPEGEALVDFQSELKALTARGVILAIVSKNTESVALEAIDNHPEMRLRRSNFAAWRINWGDKAANIADLVQSLRLGLDAAVFIDDNPIERARVKETLPAVLVPDWPEDKRLYADALRRLRCFNRASISKEDQTRGVMYTAEHQRAEALKTVKSLDEWIANLQIVVTFARLSEDNIVRATQLLNKTNQMNSSTRRLGELEFLKWANESANTCYVVSVSDRLGDSGLTGIIAWTASADEFQITDFVLSCRVMGRKVEETLLHFVWLNAQRTGTPLFRAKILETPRNTPCRDFFARSGMISEGRDIYFWPTAKPYALPAGVTLVNSQALDAISVVV